jgi:hypothetical protein
VIFVAFAASGWIDFADIPAARLRRFNDGIA